MKASIITYRFFDFDTNSVKIGGAETYINDLAQLLVKSQFETTVFVFEKKSASECRQQIFHGFKVREFPKIKNYQESFDRIYTEMKGDGLFIIETDDMSIDIKGHKNMITIQHGICWDYPQSYALKKVVRKYKFIFFLYKLRQNLLRIRQNKRSGNMVCVDYNYYNWLAASHEVSMNDENQIKVIPNHVQKILDLEQVDEKLRQMNDLSKSKIVFARRMTDYRGTLLFACVAKRLLKEFPYIDITMAGEGPLQDNAKMILQDERNVHFTKYNSENSTEFHQQFDIAVVPTIYSEGTSLSLLEAMAAGCFPIATHVGGLTNILIDNFNGRLCYPDEDSIFNAVKSVLQKDIIDYKRMVHLSFETVQRSFSKEKWETEWLEFIHKIIQ
jgi:glycosyltransferase involved in cell wall biosynthesis